MTVDTGSLNVVVEYAPMFHRAFITGIYGGIKSGHAVLLAFTDHTQFEKALGTVTPNNAKLYTRRVIQVELQFDFDALSKFSHWFVDKVERAEKLLQRQMDGEESVSFDLTGVPAVDIRKLEDELELLRIENQQLKERLGDT